MINLQQQTPEWYEFRKSRIGASDSSTILGINPWRTARQLMEEKLGLKQPEPINERMQRGIDLEPRARQKFFEDTGYRTSPVVVVHPEYEWMMASLDGISDCKTVLVEIKCNGKKNHDLALEGKVPDYYFCQMQHQMAVTNLQRCYYYSFDGEKGVGFEVLRDDEFIANLIEKEKEFYQMYLEYVLPPEPYKNITDPMVLEKMGALRDIKKQIKWLQDREEDLEKEIIQVCGNHDIMGSGLKFTKQIRKGNVDYKTIPELKGVDLDKHRKKSTEYWRVTMEKE